jgi:large subunit ribosomal protein L17
MRHRNKTLKLGRKSQHRHLMLANLVCSLIQSGRVQTTVEKAKAARSLADKMVTLAKKGTLHHRRLAISRLRQEEVVQKLFTDVGPRSAQRNGGYTRIIRLGQRIGDAASCAYLEWVDQEIPAEDTTPKEGKKAKSEKGTEKEAAK